MGHRVLASRKRRVLLFVGEHERVRLALRPGRFEFARFGFGFPAEAADRLGQGVDVSLVLAAKLARDGEHRAAQQRQGALVGGDRGQFLGEDGVEDLDVGGLFAVGRRPVPAAPAAGGEQRRKGEQKDGGATEAAPLPAEAIARSEPIDGREAYVEV